MYLWQAIAVVAMMQELLSDESPIKEHQSFEESRRCSSTKRDPTILLATNELIGIKARDVSGQVFTEFFPGASTHASRGEYARRSEKRLGVDSDRRTKSYTNQDCEETQIQYEVVHYVLSYRYHVSTRHIDVQIMQISIHYNSRLELSHPHFTLRCALS